MAYSLSIWACLADCRHLLRLPADDASDKERQRQSTREHDGRGHIDDEPPPSSCSSAAGRWFFLQFRLFSRPTKLLAEPGVLCLPVGLRPKSSVTSSIGGLAQTVTLDGQRSRAATCCWNIRSSRNRRPVPTGNRRPRKPAVCAGPRG